MQTTIRTAPCRHKRCRGERCRVPQSAHKRLARQLAGKLMRWGMREDDGIGFALTVAGLVGCAIAAAPLWVR